MPIAKKGIIVPEISEDKKHSYKNKVFESLQLCCLGQGKGVWFKTFFHHPKNIQFQCILMTPSL